MTVQTINFPSGSKICAIPFFWPINVSDILVPFPSLFPSMLVEATLEEPLGSQKIKRTEYEIIHFFSTLLFATALNQPLKGAGGIRESFSQIRDIIFISRGGCYLTSFFFT